MWIVRLALNRPYTFVVLAILILLLGPAVILRTPTDIFPNIDIPVISVAWTYTGLNPEDLETRLTTPFEKGLTTLVDNIEHIESTTYNGTAVVKIYLQPGASVDRANSQVVALSGFILRLLPPATQPPEIINFSASSVPVLQLGVSGPGMSELKRMKPRAWLINASRGPIVEEQALISVLKNKQIAGAAIDVFDVEPLPPFHPFRMLDNVLATPHIGYVSQGLYKTFYEDIVSNIQKWLDARHQ
jgi:hypothetical protein